MKRSTLILIVNITVIALIFFITLATHIAPIFTWSLLFLCFVTFLYILSEQWMTHDAVEFENRFWTLMAFILAYTCLFCSDSPLRFSEDRPGLAWFIVFLSHNYDRHLHRVTLTRSPNIRRIRSAEFGEANRSNAHQKVLELRKLVHVIDHTWMSSTFLNLFFLPRVLYIEHQIITIMAEANADELNLIISNVECALLFYKVKDHKIARQFNRTNLLKLLALDRISELNVPARVVLLDGLMRMKLSAHPCSEQYVKNIVVTTKTDDLSELKSLTDSKGDVNSMHKLLYTDIRNGTVKESILKYISQQANIQAAHSTIGSRRGKKRDMLAWRKILSDVDDTLTCSGGSWPAGLDISYPKKAVYPGVLAFYRELDLGVAGVDEWPSDNNSRVGNLVFLSARPHVYKSVSENVTYSKFRALQQERGLYTCPTLLAGSLDTGSKFMVKGDTEPLAKKKFDNFREYLTLYPEYTCIFIGDNGQGDVRTAEMVLEDQRFSDNLHRVYIHQVQPKHLTYCSPGTIRHSRLYYFTTYIDAAIDAYKNKLIRASGLRKVMQEACTDFNIISATSWTSSYVSSNNISSSTSSSSSLNNKSLNIQNDNIKMLESYETKHIGNETPNKLVVAKSTLYSSFTLTTTNSSKTNAVLAKHVINPTVITKYVAKTGALYGESYSAASMGFSRGGAMIQMSPSSTVAFNGDRKRELRMRELNQDLVRGNVIMKKLELEPVPLLEFSCRHNIGSIVSTMFGKGIITNFRGCDGIYKLIVCSNVVAGTDIDIHTNNTVNMTTTIETGSIQFIMYVPGVAIHT